MSVRSAGVAKLDGGFKDASSKIAIIFLIDLISEII